MCAQQLHFRVSPESETVLFLSSLRPFDSFGLLLAGSQNAAEPEAKHLVTFLSLKKKTKLRAH